MQWTITLLTRCAFKQYWLLNSNLNEQLQETKLTLYPNPVTNKLYVKNILNGTEINFYNSQGRLIKTIKYVDYLDVSRFPSGLYFLTVNTKNIKQSKIFIKQ